MVPRAQWGTQALHFKSLPSCYWEGMKMNQKLEAYYGGRLLESLKDFFFKGKDIWWYSRWLHREIFTSFATWFKCSSKAHASGVNFWSQASFELDVLAMDLIHQHRRAWSPSTRKKSPQWPRFLVLAHASSCFGFSRWQILSFLE